MMDMQFGLLARQRHHERIEHALGPRPERYGPPSPRPRQRSFAPRSRIAHRVRLPALLIPRGERVTGRPIVRTTLFRLALFMIVGLLLSAAPNAAFARAQKTALSGDQKAATSFANAAFQSVGKWTVITNAQLTGSFAFSGEGVTLTGTLTRVVNVKLDAAKNGILWGTVSYVDASTGLTCTGFNRGTLSNDYFRGEIVASCSDGSLLQGRLQDTVLTYDAGNLVAVESHFTGILINPSE